MLFRVSRLISTYFKNFSMKIDFNYHHYYYYNGLKKIEDFGNICSLYLRVKKAVKFFNSERQKFHFLMKHKAKANVTCQSINKIRLIFNLSIST